MEKFTGFILKILGWKLVGEKPAPSLKKLLIVEAPHTSNWDYFYGMLCIMSVGIKVNVIIKKEIFFWPLGPILKALGGVPIDRTGTSNKVETIASFFENRERLNLAITPEGTRSLSTVWKKGYYYIAQKAQVPILLTSLDYKKKEGCLGPHFIPTGDYKADFKHLESFYRGVTAKYPEKFSLSQEAEKNR